jgi:hypothetical protein
MYIDVERKEFILHGESIGLEFIKWDLANVVKMR